MREVISAIPSMTVKNFMETECLDVDEILLSNPQKNQKKNMRNIRPLSELVKGGNQFG